MHSNYQTERCVCGAPQSSAEEDKSMNLLGTTYG